MQQFLSYLQHMQYSFMQIVVQKLYRNCINEYEAGNFKASSIFISSFSSRKGNHYLERKRSTDLHMLYSK